EVAVRDTSLRDEPNRAAQPFVEFLRAVARGGPVSRNYTIAPEALLFHQLSQTLAAFTATSYTFMVSAALGARWNVFPNGVGFTSVGTEPGAPGNGSTAITTAFSAWNNDANSNVNYVYNGADNGSHTSGLSAPDGANTIAFERDLSAFGVPPFT